MKIVFFCGSLEPGKDGVGDYLRRLAGELMQQGNEAGIVALNDEHISYESNSVEKSSGVNIPTLRLPDLLSFKKRFQKASLWINEYDPDWLSLQFVPFAFHRKGLPFNIAFRLANLGKKRRWHIMFHELWVGMEINAPWKQRILGFLQRRLIKLLITKLKPEVIHTHARLYIASLQKLGYHAQLLPLFGNISLKIKILEKESASTLLISDHLKQKSFVLFGGIHSGAPVEELAKDVATYCIDNKMKILLTFIGRCGPEQEHWASVWESAGLPVKILGEQPPERISNELDNASLGIATTPVALVDKSGSVAAMLDHGLPVLCVSRYWKPRSVKNLGILPGVMEYKSGKYQEIFSLQKLESKPDNIKAIVGQFLNDLLVSV